MGYLRVGTWNGHNLRITVFLGVFVVGMGCHTVRMTHSQNLKLNDATFTTGSSNKQWLHSSLLTLESKYIHYMIVYDLDIMIIVKCHFSLPVGNWSELVLFGPWGTARRHQRIRVHQHHEADILVLALYRDQQVSIRQIDSTRIYRCYSTWSHDSQCQ